ncbi:MAG: ATP-binding protein, partial [bacterium]|nr:ATP-binding protein [bacterium]
ITKQNANNIENRIYKWLLFWNFISLIFHLFFQGFGLDLNRFQRLSDFMGIIYFASIVAFLTLFVSYMVITTNENNEKFMKFINNRIIFLRVVSILLPICVFLLLFVTDDFHTAPFYGGLLMGGLITNTIYYVCLGIDISIAIFTIVKNKGKYEKKKAYPFYAVGICAIFYTISSIFYPGLCLFVVLEIICTYIMYHTIENPDMKLVNELTLAKNQAEKANNAKSDFLSSMSHELRTPLNAIVGFSQMISSSTDNPEIQNDANDILKASNSLLELVDGILDINNLDSNNMEIVNVNYNPLDLFNELEKNIRVRIGEKAIDFRCRFSDDLPTTLNGDRNKIKSIVTNILTNAVKYTDKGYIEFSIDCINKDDICNLRINITDTGKGISDADVEKIFDKFYRSEENKDSDISGTGLGLAITKSLVDLMGGKITVNSTEEVGSTFLVTLSQGIVQNSVDAELL